MRTFSSESRLRRCTGGQGNGQNQGNMCSGTVQAFHTNAGGTSTIRSKKRSSSGLIFNLVIFKSHSAGFLNGFYMLKGLGCQVRE